MSLNFNDEILLNDTELCIVASKTYFHGKCYYLLINVNTSNEMICFEEDGKLLEVGIEEISSEVLRRLISLYKINLNTPLSLKK